MLSSALVFGQSNRMDFALALAGGDELTTLSLQGINKAEKTSASFSQRPVLLQYESFVKQQIGKDEPLVTIPLSALQNKQKTICFGTRCRITCKVKAGKLLLFPSLLKKHVVSS